jgi:homoserine O-acetyltransferase
LDPTRQRIVCFNQLGSCYGSFGPADEGFPARPPTGDPAVARWPAPLTAFDQARAILLALDGLGITHVEALIGGSLGGMVALSLAVLAPERFGRVVNIAGDGVSTAWIRAYNHVGRSLIAANPHQGLDAARQLAMISYRAPDGFQRRFADGANGANGGIGDWLDHHGRSLVARFDPFAYVAQLDAMDQTDVDRVPRHDPAESWHPSGEWGLKRYTNPLFGVGISTDQLYPPARVREIVDAHVARGGHGAYAALDDDNGHDAFLIAFDPLRDILHAFLDR